MAAAANDPVAVRLEERGFILSTGKAGELFIECPWLSSIRKPLAHSHGVLPSAYRRLCQWRVCMPARPLSRGAAIGVST
ncbi:hypothetical protein LOK85_12315 [Xylella fastidiosa subsp. multiplex]|uniref:hypothetical protein n=1 Tax=Xylella fastidiosa TaxID=2371 RepID=UPI00234CC8D9|nr:hypothetical protein [Xylella fastidiosa]MDC6416656.1 hypothetical protein [Xylella fastidiosa subsp. multiplex]